MVQRVKFEAPPVVEVVCAVSFGTPRPLKTALIGAYGLQIESRYPSSEDTAPLPPLAALGPSLGGQPLLLQQLPVLMAMPPLRRTWFASKDNRDLIQVQDEMFVFNWRRTPGDEYVTFEPVMAKFDQEWGIFRDFLATNGLGDISYQQFEMVYVNRIDHDSGLNLTGLSGVLVDHTRDATRDRFLPEPQFLFWQMGYPMPDRAGVLQLVAQIMPSANGEPYMRLDVAARGIGADRTEQGRRDWFELAHTWITHGFADATSPTLHEAWKRIS